MPITISSNLASLVAQNNLGATTKALGKNFQRLATGLRINSAKDDPAGAAISTRLTAQIKGLNVAKKNANDGLSLSQVADSALEETTNAIQKIRDLASEAQNSTASSADRASLQTEVNLMISEIQRLALEVEFNDTKLLSGGFVDQIFHIGPDANDTIKVTIASATISAVGFVTGGNVSYEVSTATFAASTVTRADSALDTIANIRSGLGGVQNRFESIINTIDNLSTAYTASRSQIMDVDVAQETSELTRNVILQQAGVAVLAQANLQPQIMLKLLNV